MLELSVFGPARLEDDGRERPALREIVAQPKRLGILVYLVLGADGHPLRRDRLIAAFWPDLPAERARAALRRSLWYLGTRLGEGVLEGRGSDVVGVSRRRLRCDVLDFDSALADGADERAIELYGGPFLDGLFVRGAPEFEDWCARKRDRLRTEATSAALRLAERAERADGTLAADPWLRRALEITPFAEIAIRRRLSLLARSGQRDEAIRAFEAFEDRLRADYDLSPAPETVGLVAALRSESADEALSRRRPAAAPAADPADGPAANAWATMDRTVPGNRAAVELFQEWLKDDESSAEAYAGLAAAYAHGVQLFGRARTELGEALRAARVALVLDERLPQVHIAAGLGLEFGGRLGEADAAYRMAIRVDRGRGLGMSQLGRTRMLAGDFAEALGWARRTLRIAPDDPHVSLQVALNLYFLGHDDEGDRQYEATLERWPAFPWAHGSWAYMHIARGDVDAAARTCRMMLRSDPDSAVARLTAGIIALHAGREAEATESFETLHRLDPDLRHGALFASVRSYLSFMKLQRGDREEANRLLREAERANLAALAQGGSIGGIFYDQGTVCALRGDHERALDWLEASYTAGFKQPDYASRDPLLDTLRHHDRYTRWIAACRADLARQNESVR